MRVSAWWNKAWLLLLLLGMMDWQQLPAENQEFLVDETTDLCRISCSQDYALWIGCFLSMRISRSVAYSSKFNIPILGSYVAYIIECLGAMVTWDIWAIRGVLLAWPAFVTDPCRLSILDT